MSEVLGGYLVVEAMNRLGVEYLFGMPGFQLMSVYDGIYHAKTGPRHILIHDEKCGAFMAYGYARMSGKPGVCDATVGPGATNLVSGLAEAYYASTPLVAITSDVRMEFVGKSPNQECDQTAIFNPVVKRHFTAHLPERIIELTVRALQVAASGRPGPVHLNLPENINYTPIAYDWKKEINRIGPVVYPMNRPRPESELIEKAAAMLTAARRPVCIAGGGVHLSRANEKLLALAEKLMMPVATSLTGKGAIPEDHPLALSMCGRFDRYANQFIQKADLVFVIGSKLGEVVTSRWSAIPEDTPIIHCDIDATEIHRNYPAAIGMVGDARSCLEDLLTAIGGKSPAPAAECPTAKEIAAAKEDWMNSVRHLTHSDAMPTNPARVLREIRRFLPKDGLLTVDGGLATHWAGLFYDVQVPGRGFMPNRGQAAIGCGFPAAMGAQLAAPDKPVVAFVGDGGFCQGIAELETAARENIPVIVVVLNNNALGYVKSLQHVVFDKRYQSADYTAIRFDKIAEGFGCRGEMISSLDQIVPALERARESGKPTVIEIPTTRDPGEMLPKADARAQRC
jgi:acetolactate synthase I/II/III large subunit